MLPPTPQLLVSTATTLAAREFHRKAPRVEDRHARADQTRGDATLRFVHFAGFWSHFAPESQCSSWPLPRVERIEELAGLVERHRGLESIRAAGDHAGAADAISNGRLQLTARFPLQRPSWDRRWR